MNDTAPPGGVTKSEAVSRGLVRENGASLAPLPWAETPGFHERIELTGQDPDAIRRMIRRGAVV